MVYITVDKHQWFGINQNLAFSALRNSLTVDPVGGARQVPAGILTGRKEIGHG
jgi:hypothetical protein